MFFLNFTQTWSPPFKSSKRKAGGSAITGRLIFPFWQLIPKEGLLVCLLGLRHSSYHNNVLQCWHLNVVFPKFHISSSTTADWPLFYVPARFATLFYFNIRHLLCLAIDFLLLRIFISLRTDCLLFLLLPSACFLLFLAIDVSIITTWFKRNLNISQIYITLHYFDMYEI
jgi:hypothetical protein